jgi:polyribonucleotide 5'-hydroxyl-kinase
MEDIRQWTLEPMQEFRFEIGPKSTLKVKVISTHQITKGTAEVFGTELAANVEYQFSGKKLAIFTWKGCNIETSGKDAVEYIGHETPKQSEINVHFALHHLRQKAATENEKGPRVMILGPADVGKTSLAKTLVNYATRSYTGTLLCELDPSGVCIDSCRG